MHWTSKCMGFGPQASTRPIGTSFSGGLIDRHLALAQELLDSGVFRAPPIRPTMVLLTCCSLILKTEFRLRSACKLFYKHCKQRINKGFCVHPRFSGTTPAPGFCDVVEGSVVRRQRISFSCNSSFLRALRQPPLPDLKPGNPFCQNPGNVSLIVSAGSNIQTVET